MPKIITTDLSEEGLTGAIRKVEMYKAELRTKLDLLFRLLLSEGAQIASARVIALDAVYTTELVNSIDSFVLSESRDSAVGVIQAGAAHAVYVEFGTGIVGKGTPHPLGGNYDVNGHGEDGWWYFDENAQQFFWTQGMESRPFMYETAKELRRSLLGMAREVFSL